MSYHGEPIRETIGSSEEAEYKQNASNLKKMLTNTANSFAQKSVFINAVDGIE